MTSGSLREDTHDRRLEEIRARAEAYVIALAAEDGTTNRLTRIGITERELRTHAPKDIPWLLAEIERLRAASREADGG